MRRRSSQGVGMMWDHTAYCRDCGKRVFVQPRYYSHASGTVLMICTLGLFSVVRWMFPERYGLWQCDECGSLRCVDVRRVRTDGEGNPVRRVRRRHHRSSRSGRLR